MDALAALQFAIVPALASALLHATWQVALIGVAAALALHAMARWNAAARHTVAMGFLVAMLAAPAWQFVQALRGPAVEAGEFVSFLAFVSRGSLLGDARAEAIDTIVQATSPIAAWIVLPWLLGVGAMLFRHVVGLRALSAMTRAPHAPLPVEWRMRMDALRHKLGIARTVAVHVCDDIVVPCAARWLRPVVFVPAGLLARAPAEHLEALLAHELAHVARRDWLWNGVQCVVETVLFFHPAVWWLGKRIRQEREHACDDLAVTACGDAIALAEALAALERNRHHAPTLPTHALAATGGPLMQRIRRLLSVPPSRARWGALAALGALSIGGALLAVQLGFAGGHFPDLQVSASTEGPLGPGDWREIIADGVDKRREYRIQVDANGKAHEVYEENGRAMAIDADTRRWIAELSRPVVLPPPPDMPAIGEDIAFSELVAQLSLDDRIVARIGAPVSATTAPNGNVHLDGANGDADVVVELEGPKGRARFAVVADRRNAVWTVKSVAAR